MNSEKQIIMNKVYGLTLICCAVMFLLLGDYHIENVEYRQTIVEKDSIIRYYKQQDSIGLSHARINLILMKNLTPRSQKNLQSDSAYMREIGIIY